MNVKRFIGRNSREAMQKVKAALGDEAIVLSTKPASEGGIEILAMGAEGMAAVESMSSSSGGRSPARDHREPRDARAERAEPQDEAPAASASGRSVSQAVSESVSQIAHNVQEDVKQLAMSTLSFQDYVRERMLKRRQAAIQRTEPALAATPEAQLTQRFAEPAHPAAKPAKAAPRPSTTAVDLAAEPVLTQVVEESQQPPRQQPRAAQAHAELTMDQVVARRAAPAAMPAAAQRPQAAKPAAAANPQADRATLEALKAAQEANAVMLGELRAMRAMVTERFETMAFLDKLGRTPAQATLAQRLLDGGFSTVLIRKLLDAMPAEVTNGQADELAWATQVLQRNLNTADTERAVEDQGGIFALIGATGVGKTTTTAKLAATFAAKHGANNLGLITLDAYRVGAHEQLRAYGRILGVPVHMAHDRAALEDLLELLSGKKLILIDTAGMAQRDSRTKDLLDMLSHPSIKKLLVINASAQGDAIEDVMHAYQAQQCAGVVLSKLDEAVKLGPALDALIRHKLKVLGVANGQRVPEDWHRLSSQALVHRAMRASLNPAYRLDPNEVSLILATPSMPAVADMLTAARGA
ncbi:flagellar biosynthesis protein FlhF [Aquabacterium commune]|uniref:Flagellar biosynthesis protein FlhF n=1 Tax=Aquabacterium commune TaxID=70586 RepID=A0A4R6RH34_9BURK|nr:flagellar biosynthesis protein FlhF [Aquabacterium commune]TDP85693.1 flagellar biosynthesis protein FlhF [Aquabacterium commune]